MTIPVPDNHSTESPVRVGIGLIRRGNSYLVRQRPEGAAMAGYWEFPGGKCEPGESPPEATRRECLEETGLEITLLGLRDTIEFRYPHAWVVMSFFDATVSGDTAAPALGSGFTWKTSAELQSLRFPGANEAILRDLLREASSDVAEQS